MARKNGRVEVANFQTILPARSHLDNVAETYQARQNNEELFKSFRAKPGHTKAGKPFNHVVKNKVAKGAYKLEFIPANILGTKRPIEVYRASRAKNNIIKPWESRTDDDSYCPAHWADIAIGRGSCGFRCRACFLILTHRTFCDPSRHVLYDNIDDYQHAVSKELEKPGGNLGLGIDCSDSLLYEGVTEHARRLIPLFADTKTNPYGRKLILLTKSTNVHYLEGLPTKNILVTFSINPEIIADLWEGKWPDGLRITPPISKRLAASINVNDMGFEVRWRIDPIFPVDNWQDIYHDFFVTAAFDGHRPTRITLGTYREMGRSLLAMARGWGLPAMEWIPEQKLSKDGMHYHLPEKLRIEIYKQLADFIKNAWSPMDSNPLVALCKESKSVRCAVGITDDHCNCE